MELNKSAFFLKWIPGKVRVEAAEIKKIISICPFKPFEFHLEDGSIHFITHPEIIVTDSLVAPLDQNKEVVLTILESVHSIHIKN